LVVLAGGAGAAGAGSAIRRAPLGEGIPLYFYDYRVDGRVVERGMPSGGMSLLEGPVGQVVEHAGEENALSGYRCTRPD
jgi:hypothetical protein